MRYSTRNSITSVVPLAIYLSICLSVRPFIRISIYLNIRLEFSTSPLPLTLSVGESEFTHDFIRTYTGGIIAGATAAVVVSRRVVALRCVQITENSQTVSIIAPTTIQWIAG